METVVDEIDQAISRLGLSSSAMRLLSPPQSEAVFYTALDRFVASGDRLWWEDFRRPGTSIAFEAGEGWRQVPKIVPNPNESVWFIAEDDSLPHFPVFETTPEVASLVIGECYGFEYYLVAKDLSSEKGTDLFCPDRESEKRLTNKVRSSLASLGRSNLIR